MDKDLLILLSERVRQLAIRNMELRMQLELTQGKNQVMNKELAELRSLCRSFEKAYEPKD